MAQGKTYNKSPRRIHHKAPKSNTNTGTTALERSVEQTTRWSRSSQMDITYKLHYSEVQVCDLRPPHGTDTSCSEV